MIPADVGALIATGGALGWALSAAYHVEILIAGNRARRRLSCRLRGHCKTCLDYIAKGEVGYTDPLSQTCCRCDRPVTPAAVDAWR